MPDLNKALPWFLTKISCNYYIGLLWTILVTSFSVPVSLFCVFFSHSFSCSCLFTMVLKHRKRIFKVPFQDDAHMVHYDIRRTGSAWSFYGDTSMGKKWRFFSIPLWGYWNKGLPEILCIVGKHNSTKYDSEIHERNNN